MIISYCRWLLPYQTIKLIERSKVTSSFVNKIGFIEEASFFYRMNAQMDITPRKISYRSFPKEGLFKKLYREDMYKIEEFKEDFKYYENTSIEEIIIDEYHLIPFVFFSPEGINYLMPKIIEGLNNHDIATNLEEFIAGISTEENIIHALNLLKKDELLILKAHLEKILFGDSLKLTLQIGEYYLFRSIEYLEELINGT